MRGRAFMAAVAVMLTLPAAAHADPAPLGIGCTPQAGGGLFPGEGSHPPPAPLGIGCTPQAGVRFCQGNGSSQRVATFDGVPLDADATLPATGDGPFPTIVMLHGWGGSKTSFESADGSDTGGSYHYSNIWFAKQGYAVLNYTARGW